MKKSGAKIRKDHFIMSSNRFETLLFNFLTISLFLSIFLTMGFTRIFPLNLILKFLLIATNILIAVYLIFYSKITLTNFLALLFISATWFIFVALLNKSIKSEKSFILNIINMIPLYLILIDSEKMRNTFYSAMVFGLISYVICFTIYYASDLLHLNFDRRLGSFFGNQNDVAATLLIASTLFLYNLLKKKFFFVVPLLFSVLALLSTGSRAGLLNLIIVSIIVILFVFKNRRKLVITIGLIMLVIVVLLIMNLSILVPIKERMLDLIKVIFYGESTADASTSNRIGAALESFILLFTSPLLGNQLSLFNYSSNQMVAHNGFLEIASRQGLISLLFFLALFILPIIQIRKNNHQKWPLFLGLIIGSILFHLTLTSLPFKEQYLILVLAMSYQSQDNMSISLRHELYHCLMYRNITLYNSNEMDVMADKVPYLSIKGIAFSYSLTQENSISAPQAFYNLGEVLSISLDHTFVFRTRDWKDKMDTPIVVRNANTSNINHLKFLNYLLRRSHYKVIILNLKQTYTSLFSTIFSSIRKQFFVFLQTIFWPSRIISNPVSPRKNKSNHFLIDLIFFSIFNTLSVICLTIAMDYAQIIQKVILIIFSAFYFFIVLKNLYQYKKFNKKNTAIIMWLIVSVLPVLIYLLLTILLPGMFKKNTFSNIHSGLILLSNLLILVFKPSSRKKSSN